MGPIDIYPRVPFASVNRPDTPNYREGWVRHHLHSMQCLRDAALAPFLLAMRDDGFHMDDFDTNGILLPALPSQSFLSGQPLHLGGHPNYNAQIIDELHFIRKFCESIRSDSRRRKIAMGGLRGSQDRTREAILSQRAGHVDRVILTGPTDGDIDALIDRLFAVEDA
jgi:A nuclease family of the HNH/ENDO VII superfamily with conserved AHH